MAEVEKQEGQKTVVSFTVGLLIGGLLVWAFSSPADDQTKKTEVKATSTKSDVVKVEEVTAEPVAETPATPAAAERPTLPVGDGKISVNNQKAGLSVNLASAVYPVSEGWIGVRDYQGGQLGGLLGVVRFSEEQGLVPTEIVLQRATAPGKEYAVVVYREDGDRAFNLANDAQLDSVFATFSAE